MKVPCQVAHWYLLPALGAELARGLAKLGMPQKEIARCLGITPAAVSQYMKKKRGMEMRIDNSLKKDISKLAARIRNEGISEGAIVSCICDLCVKARRLPSACSMHRSISNAPKSCAVCLGVKGRSCY